MKAHRSTLKFNLFSLILCLIVFTYIVFRAVWVEPVHDELATLFHYIDYNTIWGKGTVLDANNHLLNSFLGKVCYSIFGDHIWAIRLPNVFSFLLFFYAAYRLAGLLRYEYTKYFFLIGMTCIPYVLDYFAYCRGYGMSMAFMLMAVCFFLEINKEYRSGKAIMMAVLLVLGIYANLNILITAVLIMGYIGIKLLIEARKYDEWKPFYYYVVLCIMVVFSLYFAAVHAYSLKMNGALYYGSKDGLWLTTGATLSQFVLMTTSIIVKYVLIAVISLLILHVIYAWISKGSFAVFQAPATLLIGLFIGNLVAIELMRWLLDTNYPEDRVGMQLIFLLICAVVFTLNEYLLISWISVVFVALPFVAHTYFNFRTSAFSPDDRMEKEDFYLFRKEMGRTKSAAFYLTQQLTYAYHVRKNNPLNFSVPNLFDRHLSFNEEIVSSKIDGVNDAKSEGYTLLRYNKRTWQTIFRRKKQYAYQEMKAAGYERKEPLTIADVFYNLIDTSWTQITGDRVKIIIECKVNTPELSRETLVLVVDQTDAKGNNRYHGFNLNWAAGKNREYTFRKIVEFSPGELKDLKIYLYNPNAFSYTILKEKVIFKVAE